MNVLSPNVFDQRPSAGDHIVVYPYNSDHAPVINVTDDKLWGAVPQDLVLGRVVSLQYVSGGTKEQRETYVCGDYVVSKIEARREKNKFVVSMDFVAKDNVLAALPVRGHEQVPSFSVVYDARRMEDVVLHIYPQNEMVLDKFAAGTVPALLSKKQLYRPVVPEHQRRVHEEKLRRNHITAVQIVQDAGRLTCQAKTATREWATTHYLCNQQKRKKFECDL